MKFICPKSELLNGLQVVSKAVPAKTTMTILECILVDCTQGCIKLTANDMELGIETIVEGTIEEPGVIALDAKIFLEIVDTVCRQFNVLSSTEEKRENGFVRQSDARWCERTGI